MERRTTVAMSMKRICPVAMRDNNAHLELAMAALTRANDLSHVPVTLVIITRAQASCRHKTENHQKQRKQIRKNADKDMRRAAATFHSPDVDENKGKSFFGRNY